MKYVGNLKKTVDKFYSRKDSKKNNESKSEIEEIKRNKNVKENNNGKVFTFYSLKKHKLYFN